MRWSIFVRVPGSVVGIATGYGLYGLGTVYNEQTSRKVVSAFCSVYVVGCSESSS